jgi:hypothetical protein
MSASNRVAMDRAVRTGVAPRVAPSPRRPPAVGDLDASARTGRLNLVRAGRPGVDDDLDSVAVHCGLGSTGAIVQVTLRTAPTVMISSSLARHGQEARDACLHSFAVAIGANTRMMPADQARDCRT